MLRTGPWNACGFATEGRKKLEIAEQVCKHELDTVGIQESLNEEGDGTERKVYVYAWIRKKGKGQNRENRGVKGVGFLVKEYLHDVIEVMNDPKIDEIMWIRVPGERGAKYRFL